MFPLDTVVRTKIIPPRPGPRTLERPRVTQLPADALHYRLTLVQAGAGFGKTTAPAFNALYHALEPDRDPGSESALIWRDGSAYGLRPGADVWLDAEQFTTLVAQANATP